VLGFNMLADGLRDWLDPQRRARGRRRQTTATSRAMT